MATARRQLGYVSSLTTQGIPLMTYGTATGGSSSSITVSGQNYTLLTFSSDANLVVSSAGLFDVLLIGGGGGSGGGDASSRTGGGGGGGDVVGITNTLTIYLAAGSYAVDGGAGGRRGTSASRSTIHGTMLGAIGGGGAAGYSTPPSGQEADYAYLRYNSWNGGANINNFTSTFPADFAVTAKSGGGVTGAANAINPSNASGGGGGCGSAGGTATHSTGAGGAGGNGIDISGFIGGSTYYAGAGGGGGATTTAGAAGLGGVAGVTTGTGNNGVNYGAGGGGKNGSDSGGNGQAGAVFVRFKV